MRRLWWTDFDKVRCISLSALMCTSGSLGSSELAAGGTVQFPTMEVKFDEEVECDVAYILDNVNAGSVNENMMKAIFEEKWNEAMLSD
ncbi:hypothetical protein NDU88_001706 [Pleurodeles waltl]|uniref:Uncharacterized protein n=1 Tax=Pleurodeles waltl TaxID=8319 RepID=A0AAV7S839_PLEWA|nr:hypothetical protein NDU88_001706 [Pleurodeles waltl]